VAARAAVLDDLLIEDPPVVAWEGEAGHFEAYAYRPGSRGRDPAHVHADVQLCLSLNFPGRYRSGRWSADVPAGTVSVVDAWEPHAAEDPCDRGVTARYWVLYVARARWDAAAADLGVPGRVGIQVHDHPSVVRAFAALYREARAGAGDLEQQERSSRLLATLLAPSERSRSVPRPSATDGAMLDRARDYLRAHAIRGASLAEVARACGVSQQHLSARFRARFGVPLHRFQTLMRLDHARRLLARGMPAGEAAVAAGLTDQSHLTRHFRRYLGTTPGRYGPRQKRNSQLDLTNTWRPVDRRPPSGRNGRVGSARTSS
jgi:AraC-like DNA-binding protein